MISLRVRHFGSADWTQATFSGEMEVFAAELIAGALADCPNLHVQARRAVGDWEELEDFEWPDESDEDS